MTLPLFWLTFSDSAKYAEAAKNLLLGEGLTIHHSFFNPDLISGFHIGQSFPAGFLPVTSIILAFIFKIIGISDKSVFFTGLLFYFFCAVLIFLIARILVSATAGVVSVCLFATSLYFHEYLANFSSEIPFTLEILLITYIFIKVKHSILKWLLLLSVFTAAFYTRQQTVIILISFLVSYITINLINVNSVRKIKMIYIVLGLIIVGITVMILTLNSPASPLYLLGDTQISTLQAPGTILRGEAISLGSGESFISKLFYNIYNFTKSPDRLAPTAVFLLYVIFLFLKAPPGKVFFFKLFSGISLTLLVIAASASLPNARYIHPITPLVFIGSGIALIEIGKIISPKKILNISFIICSLLFISFPVIGHYTLDARAVSRIRNPGQPPVYYQISRVMGENIPKGHLIITNLDAWASWYEGMTIMWFPLKPEMLNLKNKAEYIVITNYLENDSDFALGGWKEVVYSPGKITDKFLEQNYSVFKTFLILPGQNRENLEIQGTILRLKQAV